MARNFWRKKFACRTKGGNKGIVVKKQNPETDLNVIPISSTCRDSSCYIVENKKKNGFSELEAAAFGRIDEYEILEEISHGSYGVVYKAMEKKTGRLVAIKDEYDGFCESSSREIDVLRSVARHPSFVGFRQVVIDEYDGLYIVMEYISSDLTRAMRRRKVPFDEAQVKDLIKQLLEGVCFLHENGIMHRDLKPSNILLDEKGLLKICDFGLSRRFEETFGCYSPHVATLWYKAPELLLGADMYSCAIDMWAVGCVMAELLLGEVIFKGRSEIDQLREIHETQRDFSMLLSGLGIDLLRKLLAYNPEQRITAKDALDHDWFREIILD